MGIAKWKKTANCFTKEECIEIWTYLWDKAGKKVKSVPVNGDLSRYLKAIYDGRYYN